MTEDKLLYTLIADGLLILHVMFILFVIGGLLLIIIGIFRKWHWTRNIWFRFTHITAIAVVILQSWQDIICPLTIWENNFREKAGDIAYAGSFIQHWLHELIFYQADLWFFTLVYTLFGILVVATWFVNPPDMK